jgi:NADH dehydrogenase
MVDERKPKVVIIGAGFGGLHAARRLANKPVDVLVIDRSNFHTFTPLLYQVATCGLDPSEIAYPVRTIFRNVGNIRSLLGEVVGIDYEVKQLTIRTNGSTRLEPYDYLIVATGSVTNYFDNPSLSHYAFSLKTLSDAVVLRNHVLKLFEKAAWTDDAAQKEALTTLVVVGGGPTGIETAGALYELYNYVLKQEYAKAHNLKARVILIEATDRLLAPYPARLQRAALTQLKSLGVEVILDRVIETAAADHITLTNGEVIPTHTLIWSAGVKASPIASMLNVPLQRGERVPVEPTMQVIGREDIYAVGDINYVEYKDGQPYPQMIPVANQQGTLAADNILRRIRHEPQEPFRYFDKGIMATIGRSRAVAWVFNRIQLTGFLAWLAWLGLHLLTLMGFRNRLSVFLGWVWNYLTYDRSVRIILEHQPHVSDKEFASTDDEAVAEKV